MAVRPELDQIPAVFAEAVEQIKRAVMRPEVALDELPPPRRIAPNAFAISGDVAVGDHDLATGRFILLHDPSAPETWGSVLRCVTFARADVDMDIAVDPMITQVGWSWLTDALNGRGARYSHDAGSVTVVRTDSFGDMDGDEASAQVEVRASWTPFSDLTAHAEAWATLMCTLAGLPPLEPGVVALSSRRGLR